MTEPPKDIPSGGWFSASKDIVTFIGGLIAVLVFFGSILAWATGGLKLQSQVDIDQFRTQLNSIQVDQKNQFTGIMARLDALPRPSDYATQEAHLGRLDNNLSALTDRMINAMATLSDRMSKDEVISGELAGRLTTITAGGASATRNPR